MANKFENSNNFIVQPPKFSWLNFAYHQDLLNEIKVIKPSTDNNNKGGFFSRMKRNEDEPSESRSQSFIELTKLLTDDCQYGLLDEYAGTQEEREERKKQRELRKLKREEAEREREISEFEAKLKEEYKDIPLEDNVEKKENEEEGELNKDEKKEEDNKNEESKENQKEESVENKNEESTSNPVDKIDTNSLNKKNLGNTLYSAPVKSNKTENLKSLGITPESVEQLQRRNSFDQYVIRLNEPMPDGSPHKIATIRPLRNVTIISNNFTTSIEIKTPAPKKDDSRVFKAFLKGELKKDDNKKEEELDDSDNEDESPNYSNQIEKFKKTAESCDTVDVLLENINIKCSSNENIHRDISLDSLESVDFGKTETITDPNNSSWFTNISKSIQSWMNQKNIPDYAYFTKKDQDGNLQIMSVKSIQNLYNIDYYQALSIHDYIKSTLPKFPKNITSYTKYIEKINNKNVDSKDNKTLELIYKNRKVDPIITGDLAIKLQNQLPNNLRNKSKWVMQYSLAISTNTKGNADKNLGDLLDASQNHGPCLLIIQDENNYKFGVFLNEPLHNDETSYQSNEWFLWRYHNSELEIYRPNDEDDKDIIFSNNNVFSIGGSNDGDYGLYIDKYLKNGHSYRNKNLQNKPLASFEDFYISELELWTFDNN